MKHNDNENGEEDIDQYFGGDSISDKDKWNYTPETFNALYLHTKLSLAFEILSRACLGNLCSGNLTQ